MGTVLRLLGVGWYVAICIAGGGLGGFLLDNRLDLNPLLTLLGLGAGMSLAGVGVYRMIIAVFSSIPDSNDQRKR